MKSINKFAILVDTKVKLPGCNQAIEQEIYANKNDIPTSFDLRYCLSRNRITLNVKKVNIQENINPK